MEDLFLDVEYSFTSCLGGSEGGYYIKEVIANINTSDIDNDIKEVIGEINFEIYCLSQAREDGFDIYEILDSSEYSFRHAQSLYDFDTEDFKQRIYNYFDFQISKENYCLIKQIWIEPKYRGLNIGSAVFKNIVFHFKGECDLFFLQPYPLQFDLSIDENLKNRIGLSSFEINELKAIKKLTNYYLSWGFEKVSRIKDLLVFNAICPNPKFKSIKTDI